MREEIGEWLVIVFGGMLMLGFGCGILACGIAALQFVLRGS